MRINPIQFNFIQLRPQRVVSNPLRMNNSLVTDTVCFTSNQPPETSYDKMKKLVPKHKGIIYKKVTDEDGNVIRKIPVEVDIIKTDPEKFNFIHNGEEVGYANLCYIHRKECINKIEDYDSTEPLYKNYRDLGLVGARLEVGYVENKNKSEYGGIGHLADLLEVACCKELGIKPKIISFSLPKAGPLHYKRGKRFVPYEQYCSDEQMKNLNLYGKDFNETVREIIEKTPEGEDYVVPPFDDIDFMPLMYMPEEMVKELEKELKEHPIFKKKRISKCR